MNIKEGKFKAQFDTLEWHLKRAVILDRDGFKCTCCGNKIGLNVHHKKYSDKLAVWEYPNEYLVTLCYKCHKELHENTRVSDLYTLKEDIRPHGISDDFLTFVKQMIH